MSASPLMPFGDGHLPRNGARYQALIDSETTAVCTCDATGVINYYNSLAAELWGRKPIVGDTDERFCGSQMLYRANGTVMPHDQCPMADVLAGRFSGIYDAEVYIRRPDGSRILAIVNIAPLIDDDGAIVGAVNSFREKPPRQGPEPK